MRITGSRMLTLAAQATSRAQSDVATASDQLSSGKKVTKPSDDPLAWAQARRAAVRNATSTGRGDGLALGRDHLVDTERALASLGDIFAESQALAVQAANGSYSAADRATMGAGVAARFATALAAANTRDSAGEYVLGGSLGTAAPFDAAGAYLGDTITRSIELDDATRNPSTVAGSSLTAAEGIDVLPALARFVAALAANDQPAIATAIDELGAAQTQLSQIRGRVGGMLSAIDDADVARGELEDTLTARISDLVEVDLVEGASSLTRSATALSASQAVSAKLAALLSPA